jgi:hypothetical protein
MTTRIAARVQAHPSRRELRERLLPGLAGMSAEVIETDFDPPNPWYGYLECLRDPPDCTHLLIVQDDTVTCRNLLPAVEALVRVEGDVPVCLYLGGLPMRTRGEALKVGKAGKHFVDVHPGDFMPVVAVLWPIEKAREFHAWGTDPNRLRQKNGRIFEERSDDAMGGRWMRQTRQRVVATIPSLIEHPDDVISTIARSNTGRTALFWHGEHWDALSIDWCPQ